MVQSDVTEALKDSTKYTNKHSGKMRDPGNEVGVAGVDREGVGIRWQKDARKKGVVETSKKLKGRYLHTNTQCRPTFLKR